MLEEGAQGAFPLFNAHSTGVWMSRENFHVREEKMGVTGGAACEGGDFSMVDSRADEEGFPIGKKDLK